MNFGISITMNGKRIDKIMLKHLREYIDFNNYDVEEYDYDNIDRYTNKKGAPLNYCIKVSEQDLDRFIDKLEKRGYKWNSGESVRSKYIFYMQKDGYYYIVLFIDHLGRKKIVNADMSDKKIIIDFK